MQTIALPKKVKFEKGKNTNEGKIIVEPCFPGYGITLGNAIRRILLSSLPGGAAVGVKIKDVNHEFTAHPYLKEDILEFILNLKQLRLKVFTEEPIILELDIHGKKKITAGDITKNSNVEIVNPELVLGNISDMAGSLSAEIYIEQGMGYDTIESRENKVSEIGYIEMDSIFSPIMSAGVEIESVRVGKMTNWDRLVLNVKTDGTITPEEAFKRSVNILMDQVGAINSGGAKEEAKVEDTDDKKESEEVEEVVEKKTAKRGRPKKEK